MKHPWDLGGSAEGVLQRRPGRKEEQILNSADSCPCSSASLCAPVGRVCYSVSASLLSPTLDVLNPVSLNLDVPLFLCAQELLAAEFGFVSPIVVKENKKMCLCLCE